MTQNNSIAKMISSLPKGWKYIKLDEVCLKAKAIRRKEKNLNEEFDYIDIGCIDSQTNTIVGCKVYKWEDAPSRAQQIIQNDDILFSTVRTYLKNIALFQNNQSSKEQVASTGFCVVRANQKNVLPKYLFYYSLSQSFLTPLNKLQTGSSYPAVRDKDVFAQIMPICDLPIQQQIVAKIETLFTQIDAALQTLQTLQQQNKLYRQTILQQAFEGKLVNVGKMKWVRVKDTALNIQYGYTESSTKVEVGPKFLRITDIQDNKVNWAEVPFCNINSMDIDKYKLKDGDLVFARTGATVGKSFLISGNIPNAVFASYLIRLRFPVNILGRYIWYFFQSNFYWNQIIDKQVGTGQPNVNGTKLGELNIAIPVDLNNQQLIVQAIEKHLSVADNLQTTIAQSIAQAKALKQSILQKAFSGQLIQ